jgi:hypothetical protein
MNEMTDKSRTNEAAAPDDAGVRLTKLPAGAYFDECDRLFSKYGRAGIFESLKRLEELELAALTGDQKNFVDRVE